MRIELRENFSLRTRNTSARKKWRKQPQIVRKFSICGSFCAWTASLDGLPLEFPPVCAACASSHACLSSTPLPASFLSYRFLSSRVFSLSAQSATRKFSSNLKLSSPSSSLHELSLWVRVAFSGRCPSIFESNRKSMNFILSNVIKKISIILFFHLEKSAQDKIWDFDFFFEKPNRASYLRRRNCLLGIGFGTNLQFWFPLAKIIHHFLLGH